MLRCARCAKPMHLARVIVFPYGPAKAVHECEGIPSHVRILEVADEPEGPHRGVPETPLAENAGGVVVERRSKC